MTYLGEYYCKILRAILKKYFMTLFAFKIIPVLARVSEQNKCRSKIFNEKNKFFSLQVEIFIY